jgi:hypothetical protein
LPTRRSPPRRRTKPRHGPRSWQKAALRAAEAGTQLDTAKADAKSKLDAAAAAAKSKLDAAAAAAKSKLDAAAAAAKEVAKAAQTKKADTAKRRARRNSRSSRSRSTLAARRRSFTCSATRISGGRTGARCSMRPLRFRSRSAIPISRGCRQPKRRFIEAFQKVDEIAGRKERIRRFADIKLDGAGV